LHPARPSPESCAKNYRDHGRCDSGRRYDDYSSFRELASTAAIYRRQYPGHLDWSKQRSAGCLGCFVYMASFYECKTNEVVLVVLFDPGGLLLFSR
jgi:hypothetical protein